MAAKNLIIDENYIRANSLINSNVDFNLLRPVILMAQDLKLQPLLGTVMYREILLQTTPELPLTDPPTYPALTVANRTIVDDYILPYLNWHLMSDCLIALKFRLTNKGVIEKSANSDASSTEDVLTVSKHYLSIAENYGNALVKFILANPTVYPLYYENTEVDELTPTKSAFTSGLYLED